MKILTSNPLLLLVLGAIPGALFRYLLGLILKPINGFPISTLIVNVIGSFILGSLVTMFRLGIINSQYITSIGIGFCGSLTTMSSFAYETITLLDTSFILFFSNLCLTLIIVFLSAYSGRILILYIYLGGSK